MELVNGFLSYNQREQVMSDIMLYYRGGKRWKTILSNMPDHQLLGFRQGLSNSGKLNGKGSRQIDVHINVIMNIFGANDYIVDETKDGNNMFYIGRHINKNDEFGNPINIQYGYILVNQDWRIIEVEMLGKKKKRYKGMKLNVGFNIN